METNNTNQKKGFESEYSFVLTDIVGKVIRQGMSRGDEQLDIAVLPAGIYFLRLMQDTENTVFKIIKSDKQCFGK